MLAVFVLGPINQGAFYKGNGSERTKVFDHVLLAWKCHRDVLLWEIAMVERGKPRKRATQTLVGALHNEKWIYCEGLIVDRWLLIVLAYQTSTWTERGL